MTSSKTLTRVARIGLIVPLWVLWVGVCNALQAEPDGPTLHIPAPVWYFAAGVLIAMGTNLEQLRRARQDLASLSKKVDFEIAGKIEENRDHADERLDRHRIRLEKNELEIAVLKERMGITDTPWRGTRGGGA